MHAFVRKWHTFIMHISLVQNAGLVAIVAKRTTCNIIQYACVYTRTSCICISRNIPYAFTSSCKRTYQVAKRWTLLDKVLKLLPAYANWCIVRSDSICID